MRALHRAIVALFLIVIFLSSCRRSTSEDCNFTDDARLNFIGMSLVTHFSVHGTYPDNICDSKGKPLLSWRVTLLQMGDSTDIALYKRFHLDEPWNSPHNLKVAEEVPTCYRDREGSKYTPFLGIVGENAAFRPGRPRPCEHWNNRLAAVVVVGDSDVLWTEPRDISVEDVKKGDRLRWRTTSIGKLATFYLEQGYSTGRWGKTPDWLAERKFVFDTEPKRTPDGEADAVHCILIGDNLDRASDSFPHDIRDKQGKPLLSWRVALLRCGSVFDMAQYKKFHLDEPWNSPHNLEAAKEIPEMYRDPKGSKYTPYLAVSGDRTFWPDTPGALDPSNRRSAIVVTVRDSDVFWTEPRDISAEEAEKGDRLRWDQSVTDYVNGASHRNGGFFHDEWRKDGEGRFQKPEFHYAPDKDKK